MASAKKASAASVAAKRAAAVEPIAAAEPIAPPAPLADMTPPAIVEAAPDAEIVPVGETVAVAEAAPIEVAAPIEEAPQIEEAAPIEQAAPVAEFVPVADAAPVVDSAPVSEPAAIIEAAPQQAMEAVQAAAPVAAVESVPAPIQTTVAAAPGPGVAGPLADVAKMMKAPMASMLEAQGRVRGFVESGLSDTQAKLAKLKSAADEAAGALESSYANVRNGAIEMNAKLLDVIAESTLGNFDFAKAMLSARSASELLALQSEFLRKQVELATSQSKSFGELAQKVALDSVAPIKAQVVKTFNLPV